MPARAGIALNIEGGAESQKKMSALSSTEEARLSAGTRATRMVARGEYRFGNEATVRNYTL